MTILPPNQLATLTGDSASSAADSTGTVAEPLLMRSSPSTGTSPNDLRQSKSADRGRGRVGPSSCALPSCEHDHASSRNDEELRHGSRPTNEYVLNVAFISFLGFTVLQNIFAIAAHSQSMMADCAAMYVDVVTYLFNFLAERLKHGNSTMSSRELRLRRLYLELIPPTVSVVTLVAVTVMALREAVTSLTSLTPVETDPNINLMLLFSGLNMLLDLLNVGCFARVDQAVGLEAFHLPSSNSPEEHPSDPTRTSPDNKDASVATERTPLVTSDDEQTQSIASDDLVESVDSEDAIGILNLNMCSAWTHVCADTLRSIAVLVAAGLAYVFPRLVSPVQADSWGAIVVSVIILISLLPLLQGLYRTMCKIRAVWASSSIAEQDMVYLVV